MRIIVKFFYLSIVTTVLFVSPCLAGEDAVLYAKALKYAREGNREFAYMNYRALLRDYPNSTFKEPALFAEGEYYFLIHDYVQAAVRFDAVLRDYPDTKAKLFILAYLFKYASFENNMDLRQELRNQMINLEQVSFVFRDTKIYEYTSPLNRAHKANFMINKIQYFIEGELFEEVSY